MKMQLERDRCCMLLSRGTCTISVNIIVHCKRLQEYVKSIVKDDKNVLKPETILQKNHQDSKWCIQNIIISTAEQGLVIVNFQITFRLISISQWVTLNDWGFSLITVTQSWLWGSETAVKKGRSNSRIHLTKGEEKGTCACTGALLLSGWNWYILW